MGRLLIRADGGVEVGTGHVMRCLALAQAWLENGEVTFAARSLPPAIEHRLKAEGIEVRYLGSDDDVNESLALAKELNARWVVLDGYQFDAAFARAIKAKGLRLLVIDDFRNDAAMLADLVLNQNVNANSAMYARRSSQTALLLGTRYALLRREFHRNNGAREISLHETPRILVTLGGADPNNVTQTVIEAVAQTGRLLEVIVIVGSANPHAGVLQRMAERSNSRIQLQVSPSNVPDLMAWADVAVSAAGTTCWELAFMALPMLLIVIAENQRLSAERLHALGAAHNLGRYEHLTADKIVNALSYLLDDRNLRQSLSAKASQLVDGRGAARVVTEMRSRLLTLRHACEDDEELLLNWANEPTARAASFSSGSISREEHHNWLRRKLDDPTCELLIALEEKKPVAQVRFDREENRAVISVSVDHASRGRGLGAAVIRRASCELLARDPQLEVLAFVKPDNVASRTVFLKVGFAEIEPGAVGGQAADRFLLTKKDCAQ